MKKKTDKLNNFLRQLFPMVFGANFILFLSRFLFNGCLEVK